MPTHRYYVLCVCVCLLLFITNGMAYLRASLQIKNRFRNENYTHTHSQVMLYPSFKYTAATLPDSPISYKSYPVEKVLM